MSFRNKLKSFLTFIDVFGRPIQFSYKKSYTFSTVWGSLVSILIIFILIFYGILLIMDITTREHPRSRLQTDYADKAPENTFIVGSEILTDRNFKFESRSNESSYEYNNFAVKLVDIKTEKPLLMDPTHFEIEFIHTGKGLHNSFTDPSEQITAEPFEKELFFEKCANVMTYNTDNSSSLQGSYCPLENFWIKGRSNDDNFAFLEIKLVRCKSQSRFYVDKYDSARFKRAFPDLEVKEEQIQDETRYTMAFDQSQLSNSNYLSELEENYGFSTEKIVQCSSEEDFAAYLNNVQLRLYTASITYEPETYLDPFKYSLSTSTWNLSTNYSINPEFYNSIDQLNSFDTLAPRILDPSTTVYYGFNNIFSLNRFLPVQEEFIFNLEIYTSRSKRNYERSFGSILIVMGYVGGLSKVLIFILGFFVTPVVAFKYKESLINEFYSAIDPEKLEDVNKDFIDFVKDKWKQQEHSTEKEQPIVTAFDKLFDAEMIRRLNNYIEDNGSDKVTTKEFKQYQIIYKVFVGKANDKIYIKWYEFIAVTLFSCCLCKNIKAKWDTFKMAENRLEKDTDLVAIVKSIDFYRILKSSVLETSQESLFNSLRKKHIEYNEKKECVLFDGKVAKKKSSEFKEQDELNEDLKNLNELKHSLAEIQQELTAKELKMNTNLLLTLNLNQEMVGNFFERIDSRNLNESKSQASLPKEEDFELNPDEFIDKFGK